MTTCLRSLTLQLSPKLFANRICLVPHTALPITHACFPVENLETRTQHQVEEPKLVSSVRNRIGRGLLDMPTPELHCFDPQISMVHIKRLLETSDNIHLDGRGQTEISRHFYEDNFERHDIGGESVPMAVLKDILPSSLLSQIVDVRQKCAPLTEYERSIILSSTVKQEQSQATGPPGRDPTAKPSEEQLEGIFLTLSENLPNFFVRPLDYRIFHRNLVFHNNIRGVTTNELTSYIQQMSLLRLVGHLKFAFVKMDVLKITKHPEDGTVRVRWRIRGMTGMRVIFLFWKYRLWNFKEMMDQKVDWYDGFSIFYVGGDGLVHKHVCDKMMPDEQKEKLPTTNLTAKLALLLGAIPNPSLEDLNAICMALGHTPK